MEVNNLQFVCLLIVKFSCQFRILALVQKSIEFFAAFEMKAVKAKCKIRKIKRTKSVYFIQN